MIRKIKITNLGSVSSTIDYAKQYLVDFCINNDLHIIRAQHQTAGRGQKKDSTWISTSSDNLLLTFLFTLTPTIKPNHLAQLLAASTLSVLLPLIPSIQFKWPNDLLINNKKVAGFIGEICDSTALLSLGLNIKSSPSKLNASYLENESTIIPPIDSLFKQILTQFNHDLSLYETSSFISFQKFINKHLAFKNQRITINAISGIIHSINSEGFLLIEDNSHVLQEIRSGTISQ